MKSHELCVEFQASVELVCTNALCVLDFHVIKQLYMLLIIALFYPFLLSLVMCLLHEVV